jgi:hypothetical protein
MKIRPTLLVLVIGVVMPIAGSAVPARAAGSADGPVKIANSAFVLAQPDGQDPWPGPASV